MKVIVLGAGSSAGTPVIGCSCKVCTEAHPLNCRTRASCYIMVGDVALLIDTGPDLRQQALREKLHEVSAVLYTHPHADHLNGIDDLRAFCFRHKKAIPVFGNQFTIQNIEERFGYALLPPTTHWERPVLSAHVVDEPFLVNTVPVTPIPLLHGKWPILGYRVGNVAWLTDVSEIPESSFPLLEGLDVLFLDCLRYMPHYTHLSLDQAITLATRIGARQTCFMHMTHEVDVIEAGKSLPDGMMFAFDGLQMEVSQ